MSTQRPRIISVGTANPPESYTQQDLLERYRVTDPRIRSLFTSGHIDRRHLYLPPSGPDGLPDETQGQLLDKHVRGALDMGVRAIRACLDQAGLEPQDIDYLGLTTTTGFLAPGLTAYVLREMGFRPNCARVDIVGMGCNAGLNGLQTVSNWAMANPGRNAMLACIEVCSAAYVFDRTMRTAVVNSLFGDGSAAVVLRVHDGDEALDVPQILGFESHLIMKALKAMRYDWDEAAHKFSFFLDPNIPYVIGDNAEIPVDALLARFGMKRRHVQHWLIHSGGKKVIDAMMYNLGLTAWDVRHTISVLGDYGNLSSASFLFSYQRLQREGHVRRGDTGIMVTMGPGTTLETALLRW